MSKCSAPPIPIIMNLRNPKVFFGRLKVPDKWVQILTWKQKTVVSWARSSWKETCRLSGWMVSLYWMQKERRTVNTAWMNLWPMRLRNTCKKILLWILPDMKKDLIRNDLPEKTGHVSTLQPVPEKMHRVSWQSTITHLLNLPETIHWRYRGF